MIDRPHPPSVVRQCQLLGVARSTAYYQPTPVADAELALMRRIDELHDTQLVMKGNYAALPRWLEKLKRAPREWSRLAPS